MKILMISTPFERNLRFNTDIEHINYPLGIIYLHPILENEGHIVKTLFCNNDPYNVFFKKLPKEINSFNPDVIGINVLTMSRVSTFKTINLVQEYWSNIKIVLGGVHASIAYEQILNKYPKLFVVIGEGEKTFPELLKNINDKNNLKKVNGLAFVYNNQLIFTQRRELIRDLESLPFPKHELFFKGNRDHAFLISSRGCPFKCSFCCLHTISRRIYRTRSIEGVIKEIDYLINKFPNLKTIEFTDDTLLLNIERAKNLMKELIKKNYGVKFRCSARFKPFDLELAKLMEKAGFHTIMFGLETGSRELLKTIHKAITPEEALLTWKILAKTKINAVPFFIVGFPGENEETIKESITLIKKMKKIKHFWFYDIGILLVYPNTEVYDIMKSKGKINDNYWMQDFDVPLYTVDHDYNQLLKFKNEIIFKTMTYIDLFRFILSFIFITIKKREKPRFWKERLLVPILKKLFFLI
ncbi:MAG: radical SAM protein [Nanoarchaeota archaeon]